MNGFQRFILHCWNLFYPVKIYGKENIPDGNCVIVCNHFSAIDCGFIADIYSKKDIKFLAKKELFKNKFFGKIVKSFGAIPIDRDNPDMKSILEAMKVLKSKGKLVIFPEGTRNISGTDELQELKGGTAVFAIKTKSPIVPVMMLKKAKFCKKTHIIVGEPFELSDYYGKKTTDDDMKAIDLIIREKMIAEHNKLKEILLNKKKKKK